MTMTAEIRTCGLWLGCVVVLFYFIECFNNSIWGLIQSQAQDSLVGHFRSDQKIGSHF